MAKNGVMKNKIADILILVFAGFFLVYFTVSSAQNLVIFTLGETVELSPDRIYSSAAEENQFYNYTVSYNNGSKIVHENIHLSVLESWQLRKNNGMLNFRKLNGHVSYRSAFVRSVIFLLVWLFGVGFVVYNLIQGARERRAG